MRQSARLHKHLAQVFTADDAILLEQAKCTETSQHEMCAVIRTRCSTQKNIIHGAPLFLPASFCGFLLSQNVIALKRLLSTVSVAHCNCVE